MSKKLFLALTMVVCFALPMAAQDEATELNCKVEINSQKVPNANKDIFQELKQSITDYMNSTKWTNAQFGTNEKIICNLLLVVNTYDDAVGKISGELTVQSQRPVYNSSYTTTLINFKDTKVDFSYTTGQQLVFNEQDWQDNLTGILNFWAYMIIAIDFDTFSLHGGDPYYERAAAVVRLAQSTGESGWKAFEDTKNRSAVLSAFTESNTQPIRQLLYDYHRLGFDQMMVSVDKGRSTITRSLENLTKIYDVAPMSVCLSMFKDAKLDELVNVYSKANMTEKESVYEMLYQLYPTEQERLDKIKKEATN